MTKTNFMSFVHFRLPDEGGVARYLLPFLSYLNINHMKISTIFTRKPHRIDPLHFVLSYDLRTNDDKKKEYVEQEIEYILAPHRRAKRLHDFYIIQVYSVEEWEKIKIDLTNLARKLTGQLYFIMSPLMTEGIYNGILDKGDWDEINAITNQCQNNL
jgi:hypothetical protein